MFDLDNAGNGFVADHGNLKIVQHRGDDFSDSAVVLKIVDFFVVAFTDFLVCLFDVFEQNIKLINLALHFVRGVHVIL